MLHLPPAWEPTQENGAKVAGFSLPRRFPNMRAGHYRQSLVGRILTEAHMLDLLEECCMKRTSCSLHNKLAGIIGIPRRLMCIANSRKEIARNLP